MRYEVKLPSLGEDTTEAATVSMWLANVGDEIRENDDLLELTTDKAAFTVPCPKTGRLVEKLVNENQEVHMGDTIAALEI